MLRRSPLRPLRNRRQAVRPRGCFVMTMIILSKENYRYAKAALHAAIPHVRSAHLAEALATGLGWKSNAALVSCRTRHEGRPAPLAECDGIAFADRLLALGYADIPASAFEGAIAQARLPHPLYALFRKGDRLANEEHYRLAKRLGRPMMMIATARVYAELEWDCITVDGREDDHVRGQAGDSLVRTMFEIFQTKCRGADGKPVFYGSAFTGTIKKLLPETARQLAEDYFKLLYTPLIGRSPRFE